MNKIALLIILVLWGSISKASSFGTYTIDSVNVPQMKLTIESQDSYFPKSFGSLGIMMSMKKDVYLTLMGPSLGLKFKNKIDVGTAFLPSIRYMAIEPTVGNRLQPALGCGLFFKKGKTSGLFSFYYIGGQWNSALGFSIQFVK